MSSAPTFVLAWNDHTHHIVTLESANGTGWSQRYDHGQAEPTIGPAIAYDGGTTYLLMWTQQGGLWAKAGVRGSDPTQPIQWDGQPAFVNVSGAPAKSPAVAFGANRWVAVYHNVGQSGLFVIRSSPLMPSGWSAVSPSGIPPLSAPGGQSIAVISTRAPALAFGSLPGGPATFLLVFVASNGHAIGASSADGVTWSYFADFGVAEKDPAVTFSGGRFYVATARSVGLGFRNFIFMVVSPEVILQISEEQAPQNGAGPGVAFGECTFILTEQIGTGIGGIFDGVSARHAAQAICDEPNGLHFGADMRVSIPLTTNPPQETVGNLEARTALVFGKSSPQRPAKVLVVGRQTFEAERYDVRSGSFALLSNRLQDTYSSPEGLALANGYILIAGGSSINNQLTTTRPQLFDPASETFALTQVSNTPRYDFSVVRLADGRVLFAGGRAESDLSHLLSTAILYDPQSGIAQPTAPMQHARNMHTATLLANGDVLIAGGNGFPHSLNSAELFHPSTGTFTATGLMPNLVQNHTATRLYDGRVLMAGGERAAFPVQPNQVSLSSAFIYNPSTGHFSQVGSMISARVGHTATLLPNGKVLITGGHLDEFVGPLRSAELFDPITNTFSPAGNMVHGRKFHSASLLQNGKVLIVGSGALRTAELYDFRTGTFTATGDTVRPYVVPVLVPYR